MPVDIEPIDIELGAHNLLLQCARIKVGERLLLVSEQGQAPFFDSQLCDDVAAVAASLGIPTSIVLAEPGDDATTFPQSVINAMEFAEITIFFSRLGDQVRFIDSPGPGRKIVAYTLSREYLGSPFATMDYRSMQKIHDHLLHNIRNAHRYHIEANNGTSLSAVVPTDSSDDPPTVIEFTLDLFPVMIFPPVNCHELNGRLVLENFLLSSSTRAYQDSVLRLTSPIVAEIENSRIVNLDRDAALIQQFREQLKRAAAITGGDPYRLNSWHTGINPNTFYRGDPYQDLERWGTVAYGSPRYTHIHGAGHDPGDVSFQLFDASIKFDDKVYWDRGRFVFLDQPEVAALMTDSSTPIPSSSAHLSIGL
ncbi:MAG: hypothetical protein GKR95_16545 [Gammaproteobacteria bacterium]|nr:hypothetical protein [Gammaproteobacteria bacterium]